MTLRARPVSNRQSRFDRSGGDRRSFLVNLGFTLAIVLSLLILIGYAAFSWWDDHNGTVATVNGVTLTKDDLRARLRIEDFRISYTEDRVQTLLTAGRLTQEVASQQLQVLSQRRQQIAAIAVGRLVDAELQSQLAGEEGITVNDADVEAQFLKEKTIPEERHAWVIEVEPALDPATGEPGTKEKQEAKEKADKALADLKAGKTWDEVAKSVSTATSAPQAGDLGWVEKDVSLDKPYLEALFATESGTPTDVIEGDDGIYRIGRTTEIDAEHVDAGYETQIENHKMTVADYMVAVRADAVRKKLEDKVVADLSKPGLQRHVEQIYLPVESTAPPADAVKVRHILFSPNDDPSKADELPKDDPAWDKAEAEARAAYEALKKDKSKFDQMARTQSDETSAKQTGGKQPFYNPNSPIDAAFANAIFQPNLRAGQLVPPVQTTFGWHVIQILRTYGAGDEAWLKSLRQKIVDGNVTFEDAARDQGEGPEAAKGGDIEWIARGTLSEDKETPIFATKVGEVSDVVTIANDGSYLFKVIAEEEREPTEAQIDTFKSTGFDNWYTKKYQALRDAGKITVSGDSTQVGT